MSSEIVIDQAIKNHLKLWWTDESKQAIKLKYGEWVLKQVISISKFAENKEYWLSASLTEGYSLTVDKVKNRYPFLSDEAVKKVANMAAYSWK
jgi:hypothetical protein